jgi:hypothetical protein
MTILTAKRKEPHFLRPSIKQRTSAAIRTTTTRTGANSSLNEENLVIDDEPDFNLTLKISLEDKGFKVGTLNDPLVVLDNFRRIL